MIYSRTGTGISLQDYMYVCEYTFVAVEMKVGDEIAFWVVCEYTFPDETDTLIICLGERNILLFTW